MKKSSRKEMNNMKGYPVDVGYYGYVNGRYMLFATETDYEEFYMAHQTN